MLAILLCPDAFCVIASEIGIRHLAARSRRAAVGLVREHASDVGDRVASAGALRFLDRGMHAARIIAGHFQPSADQRSRRGFALSHADQRRHTIEPQLIANSLRRIDRERRQNGGNARSFSYGTLLFLFLYMVGRTINGRWLVLLILLSFLPLV